MTPPSDYHEHYALLAEATGTTPGAKLDQDLRDLHQRHPAAFAAKTHEILSGWAAGRITSPWPFLRSAMQKLDEHRPTAENAGPERDKAIRLAETWIRNAGLYEPTPMSLLAALFEDQGRLKPWQDDVDLQRRMVDLWRKEAPRGEKAESAMLERAARWKQARDKAYEAAVAKAQPEADAA